MRPCYRKEKTRRKSHKGLKAWAMGKWYTAGKFEGRM
jgi:hypothetical protein